MARTSLLVTVLALGSALPGHAGKLDKGFRQEFEQTFAPGRSWAVLVEDGIPTTSIYGVNGDQDSAHYSIDVVDARWKTSGGLLDTDQVAVDFLHAGEILKLASISYKDNRIDLRMVSIETHEVTRGDRATDTRPEPVATNFKFFLPFPDSRVLGPDDVPEVLDYIATHLQPFSDLDQARSYAARMIAGPDQESAGAEAGRREIRPGMTALEVIGVLGMPDTEVVLDHGTRWTYPDVTVVFVDGRVQDVDF